MFLGRVILLYVYMSTWGRNSLGIQYSSHIISSFFFFIFVDIFIYSLSIYSVFGGIIVNRKAIRQLDAVVLIFG